MKLLEQIREDSGRLSISDRHYRGKMRVRNYCQLDVKGCDKDLFQCIGVLPQSPCLILGHGNLSTNERSKIHSLWFSILDFAQRTAWRKLSQDHKKQYLKSGVIKLRVVNLESRQQATAKKSTSGVIKQKLPANVSIKYIINRANELSLEKWDYNAIDWSST
jgi:hypothetical protein